MQSSFLSRIASTGWSKLPLYADRGVIVINKPPGLVCQTAPTTDAPATNVDSVVNEDDFSLLLDEMKGLFQMQTIPFPVHRLDKATTGTMAFARTPSVARELSQQFQTKTVQKTYLALVRGGRKSFPDVRGEIREPLEFTNGRVSIGTSAQAKFAATDWELVGSSPKAPISLLRLKLHTGLKHQLRVHLSHCLHTPILGDPVYTKSNIHPQIRTITKNKIPEGRIFLHSSNLSFFRYKKEGPNKRFRLGVTSPMPKDFLRICMDMGIAHKLDKREVMGGVFVEGVPCQEIPEVEGKSLV